MLHKARRLWPLWTKTLTPRWTLDLGALVDLPSGYWPANPSLTRVDGGYLASVRGLNYVYADPRRLVPTFTAGSDYHSVVRLLLLDDRLRPVRPLAALSDQLSGLEDLRLFQHQDRTFAVASAPRDGGCHMCLVELDLAHERATVTPLASPFGLRKEKNWCPYSDGEHIRFLYASAPRIVLRYVPGDTRLPLEADAARPPHTFLDSGSTPGQPLAGATVFVAHRRRVRMPQRDYVYASRLVALVPRDARVRRSPYFSLGPPTLQFISGLTLHDDDVVLAYGVRDREAWLAGLDRTRFFAALPLA